VAGGWRKLRDDELLNLYASSYVIRVIKSKRLKWAENVAYIGEMRVRINFGRRS
jgi:hypothetical protein